MNSKLRKKLGSYWFSLMTSYPWLSNTLAASDDAGWGCPKSWPSYPNPCHIRNMSSTSWLSTAASIGMAVGPPLVTFCNRISPWTIIPNNLLWTGICRPGSFYHSEKACGMIVKCHFILIGVFDQGLNWLLAWRLRNIVRSSVGRAPETF